MDDATNNANGFIRLRRKDDSEPHKWHYAVSIAHIVSVYPIFAEAKGDPNDPNVDAEFFRARPKDEAEAAERSLYGYFEVTDTCGHVYQSPIGNNVVNQLLGEIYRRALKD